MKWYKKQLDQLKKAGKLKLAESDKELKTKKPAGYSHDVKKIRATGGKSYSPVAASKLARPKTDVHSS